MAAIPWKKQSMPLPTPTMRDREIMAEIDEKIDSLLARIDAIPMPNLIRADEIIVAARKAH